MQSSLSSSSSVPSSSAPVSAPVGLVRSEGGKILGPDGRELLLRGVGLGNWLLPEGYMWGFGDDAASPRQIEALVEDLLGASAAGEFWREFRDRFITREDVVAIAEAGFDHVRLPINWRVVIGENGDLVPGGIALVDRLVEWCSQAGILVLLDLHGAPGGQTGTNIDDSFGRPELFMDERHVELTERLWTELALRYRGEPTILGYDLLNEPLPHEWQHRYPAELVAVYRRLTAAIRAVDPDHLIMYEGSHWATNWDIFTEVWDPNSVLQFHRYWMAPETAAISTYLEVGRRLGLPVYMGEGGENSPEWVAAAHQLYEDNGVGWNLWPWKKIETLTSPLSVVAPAGWDIVLDFASGVGGKPERAVAQRIFAELLENFAVNRCVARPEIVAAAFRRAPVSLPAYGFTYRGEGVSYQSTGPVGETVMRTDDAISLRRRDGLSPVSFDHVVDPAPHELVVADMAEGEWLAFEVELGAGKWIVAVTFEPALAAPTVSVNGASLVGDVSATPDGARVWRGVAVSTETSRREIRVESIAGALTLVSVAVEVAP